MICARCHLPAYRNMDGDVECYNGHLIINMFASEEVLRAEAAEKPGAGRGPRIGQTKYGAIPVEWVRRQYLDNQLGYLAICREWKKETGQSIGKDTVKKAVLAAGITPRDNATATRLKWRQVKDKRIMRWKEGMNG